MPGVGLDDLAVANGRRVVLGHVLPRVVPGQAWDIGQEAAGQAANLSAAQVERASPPTDRALAAAIGWLPKWFQAVAN